MVAAVIIVERLIGLGVVLMVAGWTSDSSVGTDLYKYISVVIHWNIITAATMNRYQNLSELKSPPLYHQFTTIPTSALMTVLQASRQKVWFLWPCTKHIVNDITTISAINTLQNRRKHVIAGLTSQYIALDSVVVTLSAMLIQHHVIRAHKTHLLTRDKHSLHYHIICSEQHDVIFIIFTWSLVNSLAAIYGSLSFSIWTIRRHW